MKLNLNCTGTALLVLSAIFCSPAHAALPDCESADSDPDGDGFGWENNTSCLVVTSSSGLPTCDSASSDTDGDGFGWENNQSCIVDATSNGAPTTTSLPTCASALSDPDGDGFGWEDNQSCVVADNTDTSLSFPACENTSSDPDGDGYGWENDATCLITADSAPIGVPSNAGSGSSDMGETSGQNNAGSGSSDMGEGGDAADISSNDGGSFSSDTTGDNVVRTSTLDSSDSREICTQPGGDWFGWMTVGDFILHNNTWAAWASEDYDWSQCIYTNRNGAKAGIYYDWGPGRGPGDYQVRSYPELIYGIKDEYRGIPKSVTGLPERVSNLPAIAIDYSMNWPQYGPERAVEASANPSYPNGTLIQGERNVAVESFFYYPDENGECSEGIVQRDGGSNHTYEVMVWLNAGAERLPAGPADYVTDVTLDGALYKVYTKDNDRKYIAFVAQNPQQNGVLNWNTFLDWTGLNAHRVQDLYGARTNAVSFDESWCMGNILVGTEVFWGEGNLDFIDWTITQRR